MSTSDRLPPGDPLRAYIEKVLELLHRSEDKSPTSLELDAVARELGLSPGDRARLESTAADALARGQGFLEHGRPQDAVAELETAAALRPDHVETLHTLASARAALAACPETARRSSSNRQRAARTQRRRRQIARKTGETCSYPTEGATCLQRGHVGILQDSALITARISPFTVDAIGVSAFGASPSPRFWPFLPLHNRRSRTKFRASFAGPHCFAQTRRMTGHP